MLVKNSFSCTRKKLDMRLFSSVISAPDMVAVLFKEVLMRNRVLLAALCSIVLVSLNPPVLTGQVAGGTIVGSIQDTARAMVAGAEVRITNNQTGTILKTITTSEGQYVFPIVPVGTYTLTVTDQGFQQAVIGQVVVPLNLTVTEDVQLRVGATNEKVEVSASSVALETHTSQASTTIDQVTYADLPIALNGAARSPTIVADLMPGVADQPGAGSLGGPTTQAYSETINGGQSLGGEVQYDGAVLAQTNVAGDYRVQPVPVEALEEFNLIQNSFSAEYTGTPGGILSFNTKSGANKFHANAYEFLENDGLDARPYFATTRTPLHQNEFGVNAGGPLYIPHVYNGTDKTFIFGYYSGFRLSRGVQPSLATVPTTAEQQGDFSNFTDPSGNVVPIYDPATTQCNAQGVCTRQQFSYNGRLNVIDPARITSIAKAFLPYIQKPINSNEINNILTSGSSTIVENRFGIKIDHNVSDKYVVHGFFGMSPVHNNNPSIIYTGPFEGGLFEPDDFMVARIGQDIAIKPHLLAHVTLGYNRDNFSYFLGHPSNNSFGIQGIPSLTPTFAFTNGYGAAGGYPGQNDIEDGYTLNGFLSWIKGSHTIKFGAEITKYQENTLSVSEATANFSYQETDLPSAPNPAATGNGFASFLIGAVDSGQIYDFPTEIGTRYAHLGLYFQDDYKATPRLTLNLGLRYDIPYTRTQVQGTLSSFDPAVPNPGAGGILGALAFAGSGTGRTGRDRFDNVRYFYWQPRLGFAYKVDDKTAVRGGFGYFMGTSGDVLDNGVRINFSDGTNAEPVFATTNLGVTPAFYLQNGFPAYAHPPFMDPTLDNNGTISWIAPQDGTTAFISNWSLDVQRELPKGFLLDIAYVGNSAHHLGANLLNVNQVDPKYLSLGNALNAPLSSAAGQASGVPLPYAGFTGTVAQALRPYPQYQAINQYMQTSGKSHYSALQVKLQRQFHNGLSVLTSYTFAKLMTNAETQDGWFDSGSQNSFNLRQEFTASSSLPPQVLNVTYVYELPVGKGKQFVNNSRVADMIIGGWAVSGIQRYQSGVPLSVTLPNTLPLFNGNLYPNLVPGQRVRGSWSGRFDPSKDVYLNAAAFSTPAPFTFGNASRDLPERGFPYFSEDLSLQKRFPIKEASAFKIGVDFFNAFNRVTFSNPNTFGPNTNPSFGHVNSQATSPRSIQIRAEITY